MTDLDRTEILEADESFTDTSATTHSKAALNVLSGADHQTFQLNKELTIGRSNPSDAIIPAPSLSKQHAKITISNGQYFITDLGSSNKTFHNKVQLRPNVCYALHDGDEVKFGEVVCSFEAQTGTDTNVDKTELNNHCVTMNDDPIKVRTSTDGVSKHNGVNESPDKSAIAPDPQTTNGSANEPTEMEDTPQQEPENIADDVPNECDAKKNLSEEDMETEPTTDSPAMVIDDKLTENSNDMEAQSVRCDQEPEPITDVADKTLSSPAEEQMQDEPAPGATRGVARKNARRARGRQAATARTRVVSTRLHRGRRNPIVAPTTKTEQANTTLEETVSTETEESPKKTTPAREVKERRSKKSEPVVAPAEEAKPAEASSNVRVSARIKERTSTGRNRQFPYTDDYVDLDGLEKRSKANSTEASKRTSTSTSPQKRVSLRQQPIDASDNSKQEEKVDIYEQMDTTTEKKDTTPKSTSRKRKSTTPIAAVSSKRSRPATPQTLPTTNTRRKQAVSVEVSPTVAKSSRRTTGGQKQAPPAPSPTTPKRSRKSTKQETPTKPSPVKAEVTAERPVRIALSSHLNFEQKHFDALRQLGFEIMDESCPVDALVVDRIRRTKKFFICLARGALILSPTWIETMIKENRYIPYEEYFLEDTSAETRYGFQLRESVRLAKQGPIFKNTKFFCTKDTSPPYDDLKDIIEAAGGKLVDKINMVKPAKDTICIVAQAHKNDYEDLFRKGVSIVSEEFVLSGISKQKLDFDSFSLFQNATTASK